MGFSIMWMETTDGSWRCRYGGTLSGVIVLCVESRCSRVALARAQMQSSVQMTSSHLWLPYRQMKTAPEPQVVARTDGVRLYLEDGRELIDGVASWWTACHGYNHPHIRATVLEVQPHTVGARHHLRLRCRLHLPIR